MEGVTMRQKKNIACGNCGHEACIACAKTTWQKLIPSQVESIESIEEVTGRPHLVCCSCKCDNLLVFWKPVAVSKKASVNVQQQLDLFG